MDTFTTTTGNVAGADRNSVELAVTGQISIATVVINAGGDIACTDQDSTGEHGFLQNASGTTTSFDGMAGGRNTDVTGLDTASDVIGTSVDAAGDVFGSYRGADDAYHLFEIEAGTTDDITPNARNGSYRPNFAGIDAAGDVAANVDSHRPQWRPARDRRHRHGGEEFGERDADPGFSLTGGLGQGAFRAEQTSYTSGGTELGSTSLFRAGGSRTVDVQASGQTLISDVFDTFNNHGAANNTFVFDPGHGLDVINQFRAGGTDHDSLSFSGSDFGNSLATVLRNAHNARGGVAILDPTSGDTVKLTGITRQQLVANRGDFSFHA